MSGEPRDFDREYTAPVGGLPARRRIGIDLDHGTITRFVVQLEYHVDPLADEWNTVVRYDHDAEGDPDTTHDVTTDGLHIDIYRDGTKVDSHELTPPLPANDGLDVAEEHLAEHLKGYIRRFERWHGIKHNDR